MNKPTLPKILVALGALTLAFVLGRMLASGPQQSAENGSATAAAPAESTVWTCSMHPQVRQPAPGLCPICAMDLIALTGDADDGDNELPRLRLSERSIALMNIRTAPVQRKEVYAELRLPGRIAVDETRREVVTARFAGRVDRLFVDFAGIEVFKGQHLAEIYSPQLYGDQEEFLQAVRAQTAGASGSETVMLEAAQTKLRLLGLSENQIEQIRTRGQASTHLTYYSPAAGTVLERKVTTGDYLEIGSPMYAIADLSQVWVELEAFESELQWLRYGQEISVETLAFPGEPFVGRIANIDPELDADRRTARVRVNLPNDARKLKPGMLVTGKVRARIGDDGQVFAQNLAGKWISPMHPEIVKPGPGSCDICGMDLVPAETLGYFASSHGAPADPLVIPATAPLLTGKRGIVYRRLPDTERPTFEARTVELGNRVGDYYPVLTGLEEGDLIVTHGQFKIDSELQIRGRPSMMSAPKSEPNLKTDPSIDDPRDPPTAIKLNAEIDPAFSPELKPLIDAYLTLTESLAADAFEDAKHAIERFLATLHSIGEHRLNGDAHVAWMNQYNALETPALAMQTATDLEAIRRQLQELTVALESTYVTFGGETLPPLRRAHCPMVEGGLEIEGETIGTWLQTGEPIDNPYWGPAMRRCGEFHGVLENKTNL